MQNSCGITNRTIENWTGQQPCRRGTFGVARRPPSAMRLLRRGCRFFSASRGLCRWLFMPFRDRGRDAPRAALLLSTVEGLPLVRAGPCPLTTAQHSLNFLVGGWPHPGRCHGRCGVAVCGTENLTGSNGWTSRSAHCEPLQFPHGQRVSTLRNTDFSCAYQNLQKCAHSAAPSNGAPCQTCTSAG